jgi:hypothetical protein
MAEDTIYARPASAGTGKGYDSVFRSDGFMVLDLLAYRIAGLVEITDTIDFIDELDALLKAENTNGYTFCPTGWAYQNAKQALEQVSALMGRLFPTPSFIPDGEGGIDIEWERKGRKVSLSCRAGANQRDFIYWKENGGRYDGDEFSLDLLQDKLIWLNNA